MHSESALLEDLVTVRGTGPVVGVTGVPDGVDECPARPRHTADLPGHPGVGGGAHGPVRGSVRFGRATPDPDADVADQVATRISRAGPARF